MMRWRINGAEQDTGDAIEVWIDASNERDARERASKLGIMVASILRDPPVIVNAPDTVKIDRRQVKQLRVSEWQIAVGVAVGIFLFIGVCVLVGALLLLLGIFGGIGAFKELALIHNLILFH